MMVQMSSLGYGLEKTTQKLNCEGLVKILSDKQSKQKAFQAKTAEIPRHGVDKWCTLQYREFPFVSTRGSMEIESRRRATQ